MNTVTGWNPLLAPFLAPFAPPDSEVQRIAADLRLQTMKDSGEMLRREIDGAHLIEVNQGLHDGQS
jgi:hypothetical protein